VKPRLLPMLTLAFAVLAMCGCSTTLVESLPVGRISSCDAAWPGRWHAAGHGVGSTATDESLSISADCTQITFTDTEKTQTEKHNLQLISTRAGDFLTFGSPDDKPACFGEGDTHCGTELMRYVRTGNRIEIFKPDHRKVHDALESHAISGYTEMNLDAQTTATTGTQTGQAPVPPGLIEARLAAANDQNAPTYHNLIAGDPDQIAQILVQHPEFFEAEPYLILNRDGPMNAGVQP
jgi:hypothetical protein